jgi:hypothetical protein
MKRSDYVIEKNIPILPTVREASNSYPFKEMEVGDSFKAGLYSRDHMRRIQNAARAWVKSSGNDWSFVVRKTGDNEVRIWRIS